MARHVVIAIPAYSGTVHLGTMRSVIHDTMALVQRGDRVSIYDESGSTDLPDARAQMVHRFLSGDGTDLVNIDNDICWEAGALLRLVDLPVDCVGGAYPKREDPIQFPVRYLPDREDLIADPQTGLLEVEAIQGGFVRYRRAMLERMCEAYSDLWFSTTRYPGERLHALFEPLRFSDGRKFGEDFSFFHRWRAIGGQVWVDPNVTMAHVGLKAFIGNLGDWLKDRPQ